jgi:hypothetical protein
MMYFKDSIVSKQYYDIPDDSDLAGRAKTLNQRLVIRAGPCMITVPAGSGDA